MSSEDVSPVDTPEGPGWPSDHRAFDTSVAHQARIYDYWLGGKDNFAADRKAGDAVIAAHPETVYAARQNRAFLGRAVRFLAGEVGIRGFLDIGTGIPAAGNTHQVAQEVAPESRVVYVDYDPVALAYARALMTSSPEGASAYIDADIRETETVLEKAARTLDFSKPVGVTMMAILHVISDDDDPYGIVTRVMDALPSGSYLAISHFASDIDAEAVGNAKNRLNELSYQQFVLRSHDEVLRFFDGLEMVEPGLVDVNRWRPDVESQRTMPWWCGVGWGANRDSGAVPSGRGG